MKSSLLTLTYFLLLSVTLQAQIVWEDFFTNSNVSGAEQYDIVATPSTEVYQAYFIFNTVTSSYDLNIDRYTASTSWANIYSVQLNIQSTIGQALDIVQKNDTIYVLHVNDDQQGTHRLLRAVGSTVVPLGTATGMIDLQSPYQLMVGENANELYLSFMDTDVVPTFSSFDFGTNSWTAHSTFIDSGYKAIAHHKTDTIYFAYTYFDGQDDVVNVYKAPKSNLTFGSGQWIGSAPLSYFNTNTSLTENMNTQMEMALFGNSGSAVTFLGTDNNLNAPVSVPINANGGGTGLEPAFGIVNGEFDFLNTPEGGYIAMLDGNQSNDLVVYRKDHASNTYTQYGPVALSSSSISQVKLASNDQLAHKLVAYVDNSINPPAYEFKITNQQPTNLTTELNDTICGIGKQSIFSSFIWEDLDGDSVVVGFFSSSNPAVLDPSQMGYTLTQNGNISSLDVYGVFDASSITVPTQVTLSFNYSDGLFGDGLIYTVTVLPGNDINMDESLEFCLNGTQEDFEDYVDVPGGVFRDLTNDTDLPTIALPGDLFSQETIIDVEYTVSTGCYNPVGGTFTFWEPPTVTLVNLDEVSACTGNDGSITAAITEGSSNTVDFAWNNGNTNDLTLNNLGAGTYVLNVFDGNGCNNKLTVPMTVENLDVTVGIEDASCFGASDGSITITGVSPLVAPIRYLWSNGFSTNSIVNLPAGTYTVNMTDANNCKITQSYTVGQPNAVAFNTTIVEPDCGQANGSVTISSPTGGTGSGYEYLWNTNETTAGISNIPYGIYSVTVTDDGGCSSTESYNVTEVGGPIVFGFVTPAGCGNQNGGVNASAIPTLGGGNFVYDWSNGAQTEDISGVDAGEYVLEVMDDNNCHGLQSFTVNIRPPAKNPICLVDVDRPSNTNLVVWEKLETVGIDYYNIYRESVVGNQFLLIDSVDFDEISVFNDVVANPVNTYWRYRISAVNDCGVEGPLSAAHKTIHLTRTIDADFVRLNWDFYEGKNYTQVEVSRKTNNVDWEVINVIPANQTSYNDPLFAILPDTNGLDYDIGFAVPDGCTATGKAEDYNYVRSNRAAGAFNPGYGTGAHSSNGMDEFEVNGHALAVFPNPTTGRVVITWDSEKEMDFELTDAVGKTIMTGIVYPGSTLLEIGNLPDGVYMIRFPNKDAKAIRIVKQ